MEEMSTTDAAGGSEDHSLLASSEIGQQLPLWSNDPGTDEEWVYRIPDKRTSILRILRYLQLPKQSLPQQVAREAFNLYPSDSGTLQRQPQKRPLHSSVLRQETIGDSLALLRGQSEAPSSSSNTDREGEEEELWLSQLHKRSGLNRKIINKYLKRQVNMFITFINLVRVRDSFSCLLIDTAPASSCV